MNWSHQWPKAIAGSLAFIGLSTFLAVPAAADPADDPCPFALSLLCRFVPIAPGLDHDIDLTTQLPASDPYVPPSPVPADSCGDVCN